jgi:hypothetical protein
LDHRVFDRLLQPLDGETGSTAINLVELCDMLAVPAKALHLHIASRAFSLVLGVAACSGYGSHCE